jgi:copper chaperone CopZ
MKKFILLLALVTPLLLIAQSKKNEKVRFEVRGNCEMCKSRIEKATLTVKGIKMASWDIPSNIISIIRDPRKSSLNDVQKAIALAVENRCLFLLAINKILDVSTSINF